jgi:hypothetical protein
MPATERYLYTPPPAHLSKRKEPQILGWTYVAFLQQLRRLAHTRLRRTYFENTAQRPFLFRVHSLAACTTMHAGFVYGH